MDSFDIKVEKSGAILRSRRLEKMTVLFRFMEVCIFLFIVPRIPTQLPLLFKLSGNCIQGLLIRIFTPGLLFILGNAIVLVLFLKSAQVSPQQTNHTAEFCYVYVESCGEKTDIDRVEEVKKQGEEKLDSSSYEDIKMRRSNSEDSTRYQNQNSCRKLRRTVTENGRNVENYSVKSEDGLVQKTCELQVSPQHFDPKCYAADELSGEEFRRRVEDFIARQQRSMRE